ncbi:hypothetical protein F2P56_017049 [Juglans regia]|uniref:Reverse transcriptase domain-containing protein n=2 Tax=Juglans regia TaxID=51240 RepID=A0A833XK16_JUGRE|nr:uncharacterized protein LOC109013073 [Juglans regia]KAF5467197.1 hypothetical protein F2P56_017049 [Juglans regia]
MTEMVEFCIFSARFSILVNGYTVGFFNSFHGLRQGDMLSPLLFLFVMEALSKMIEGLVDGGLLHGFSMWNGNLHISHLLFADDTLIFCGAHLGQLQDLRVLLFCFVVMSGLSINLAKSEIVPVGAAPDVEILATTLGFERVECRLAAWKRLYLSKGGRLIFIKSTLSNLPTYFLSLFPLPIKVANRTEKLQRDFLWSGLGEEFKFHLVNWSTICISISWGGLGIHHLMKFNQTLLGKWLWRYQNERESLWKSVIDSQFRKIWGGWCSNEVRGTHGVGLWKNIRSLWGTFWGHEHFVVGDGLRVCFWLDIWCGNHCLRDTFPTIFVLARVKEASIADLLVFSNGTP